MTAIRVNSTFLFTDIVRCICSRPKSLGQLNEILSAKAVLCAPLDFILQFGKSIILHDT